MSVWLSYEPTLSLSLSASAEATCSLPAVWQNTHRKLFLLGNTGATIAIAPDASFGVSAKGTVGFQQHSYRMLGFQSNPDGSLRRLDGKSSDPAKVTVSAELEAKAYAGVQVQVGLLDVIGVGMSIGGGLKGNASADWPPRLCLSVTPYLQGTLYAYLNAWVKEWKLQAFTVELDLGGIRTCTGQGWHVTWQSTTYGISGLDCPTESRCVAVGGDSSHGYVLRTGDGGNTWTGRTITAQERFFSVSCTDGTHCVAGGWGSKVSVTADGGATWSQVALPLPYSSLGSVYWVTCVPTGTCFALATMTRYSGTLVYASHNHGRTWSYLTLNRGSLAAMACVTASACVAVGPNVEIGRQPPPVAVSTTDGWASTTTGSLPNTWHGITGVSCASRSLCYAAGIGPQGKAARSTDFGRTWRTVDGGGLTQIAWDTDCVASSTYCVLGGDAQTVTATRDSGAHWSRTTVSGFPSSDDMNLFNVSCASRGHCVATEHGGYGKTAIVVS
ncbi:YCF48-related protein [Streptomyces sp. ME02-8801-2C]|uniref:WD40/YVTN/BNR-like repeat-containing protein n=1 Tax=Streptomyces sp. ME02-8801-2C TaxID=3028680 RepID=UPI0029A152EF|nr:YCF48-related protein [Streptomyces sp. ME02-8801-2C]MDX3452014.1 YCF48-related protein [Streptomyces sp. ME02-8801-2C]